MSSAATLTFHLKELGHAGLIQSARQGRSIRYSLRLAGIRQLMTYLTRDCCHGHPDLCGFVDSSDCGKKKSGRKRLVRR